MTLLGMGIAGAGALYLTVSLCGVDPRLPFALSSIALIVAVSAMLWAEKHLAGAAAAAPPPEAVEKKPAGTGVALFFCAVALLSPGFQAHFALNSAPLYLRFAKPAELDYLMPVFWIGFKLLIFPACRANERFGGTVVMAAGAVAGALASALAAAAPTLELMLALELLVAGAWAAVLMSAMTAAIAIGHVGCEGAATGGLFALLAIATSTRMGLVAAQVNQDPAVSALLVWLPGLVWLVAGLLLVWLALRFRAPAAQSEQAPA